MLDGQHVLVVDGERDEHGEQRAGEEGHVLGHHRQERRHETVHVLGRGLVAFAEARHELVVQLVEVAQVATAVERPAARAKAARLPLDHLRVAEESVEDLPDQDNRAQQQVGDAYPEDARAEPVGQLQPVPPALVLGFQAPLVLEQRTGAPEEDELEVVLEAARVEHPVAEQRRAEAHGQQRLVDHGHHVVLEAQDAVVDVQLGELLLVDADLVLLLDLHDTRLHLLPGEIGELRLGEERR